MSRTTAARKPAATKAVVEPELIETVAPEVESDSSKAVTVEPEVTDAEPEVVETATDTAEPEPVDAEPAAEGEAPAADEAQPEAPPVKSRISRAAKKRAPSTKAVSTAVAADQAVSVVTEDATSAPVVVPETEAAEPEPAESAPTEVEPTEVEPAKVEPVEAAPAKPKPAKAPPAAKSAAQKSSVTSEVAKRPSSTVATRPASTDTVLRVSGLTKKFSQVVAVDSIDLDVVAGDFYGIVGPNGAGKTTTLSMITGLLRPDSGTVEVHGEDVWSNPNVAKRNIGVLPDRLRLFDRLTGAQMLYYAGVLRGLDRATARSRSKDLATAFGLDGAISRLVADYSAGMTKKIALAAAMIHSPRLLVLDEPFESVDPVSEAVVTGILKKYTAAGGTVLMSSHSMELVERTCDKVAVVIGGKILADGTLAEVQAGGTLDARFRELVGADVEVEGLEWLHSFSD